MKEETKEWRPVVGYEGLYEVSSDGDVKNVKTQRVLKPGYSKRGYFQVSLCVLGKSKTSSIHRLIAMAFIENPESKEHVNHKDGIKINNNLENLEWATPNENSQHAWINGHCENIRKSISKQVVDLQTGIFYDSLTDACKATNCNYGRYKSQTRKKIKKQRFQYI